LAGNFGRTVQVKDGNVDKALRKLKKKVNNSGILMEVRERQQYVKPSTQRKLAQGAAKSRWRKKVAQDKLPKKYF
jgi:small subunit ribosomal protein S21